MADNTNNGRVSGGPAGVRSSREPDGAVEIQGITARQFSEQQYQDLQRIAEREQWDFSDDPYQPRNRPEILRQHNPLVIPEAFRDWPEVWFVHVPMTRVAWNNRQIIHEHQHRIDPQFLPEYKHLENNKWELEFHSFDAAHKKKITAYQHNQAALTEKLKLRQTVAFRSYKEAETFAQAVWRFHWAEVADQRHDPSANNLRHNAVLNQMRRIENFYCDMDNPAHVEQLKVWETGFPEGLLSDDVVVSKYNDPRMPEVVAAAEAKSSLYHETSWAEWIVEEDGPSVTARQTDRFTQPRMGPASEGDWMIVPLKLDASDTKTWTVAHWDRDQGWQFWRNGTGRPMAFQENSEEAVARRLPEGVKAGLEPFDSSLPSSHPEELAELWRLARDPHMAATGSSEFREWTDRERELALARQEQLEWRVQPDAVKAYREALAEWNKKKANGEDLSHAKPPEKPSLDAKILYQDPVVKAIIDVHNKVSPSDGLMPSHPGAVEKAQEALQKTIAEQVPNTADREVLMYLAHRWHAADGDLAKHSLGLFKSGRIAETAFTDPEIDNGVRTDGTGDWVGTKLPTGHMVIAKLGDHDQVQWVKPMAFKTPQAAYDDVVSMGGYLQIQDRRDVRDRWATQQAHYAGEGAQWVADSLTGKLPLTTSQQDATATRWALAKLPSNHWAAAVVDADGKPVALKAQFYRHADEARRDLPGGSALRVVPSAPNTDDYRQAQTSRILVVTLTDDIRRRRERAQLRAERAANPKPVEASAPTTKGPQELLVTPIGDGRAVVTAPPRDARRKNLDPEFLAWKNGELVGLNKSNKQWLPQLHPGETRDLASVPEAKRPWIVTSDKGLAGLIDAVQQRLPDAKVKVEPLIPANLVEALKERYSVEAVPLKNKEAWWALHPAPEKHTVMATHREWTLEPKEKYPGEYLAVPICVPLKRDAESLPATWASVVEAEKTLRSSGLAYHKQQTMPPEVTYMFNKKLAPKVAAAPQVVPPAKVAAPTAKVPVQADPLELLRTRATRFHRKAFLEDLRDVQAEIDLPKPIRAMQNRVATAGLSYGDVTIFNNLSELAQEAGVSWNQTIQNVQDFARHWINERPKIAQRLTADVNEPARVQTPRPAGVHVAMS